MGAIVGVEATVISDTTPHLGNPDSGAGMQLIADTDGVPSVAVVRHVLVDNNALVGIWARGSSSLVMDGSIVRRTQPVNGGIMGYGVISGFVEDSGEEEELTIRHSVVSESRVTGVSVQNGEALVYGTLVTDTLSQESDGLLGVGIGGQSLAGEAMSVTIIGSRVERSHAAGILINDAVGVLESVHVVDTDPQASNLDRGYALTAARNDPDASNTISVDWCLFEKSQTSGAVFAGVEANVYATTIRDVVATTSSTWGTGVTIQRDLALSVPASVTLDSCLIERTSDFGVMVYDSTATIQSTHIRETRADDETLLFGDGITVLSDQLAAELLLTNSRIESSHRVGLSNYGSSVRVGRTGFHCNSIDLDGETFENKPYAFEDLGGNACGCEDVVSCRVVSSQLAPPPPPLEP
jgi:hypothetical protein